MKRRRKASGSGAAAAGTATATGAGTGVGSEQEPLSQRRKKKRPRKTANASAAAAEQEQAEEQKEEQAHNDGDEEADDEQDVEFDFCDPDDPDFHAVSELLKSGTWAFCKGLNPSELTDTVVGQGNIGTLIKSDAGGEHETVCGLLTVLNLQQFKHLSWPEAICKALSEQAQKHTDAATIAKLQALLEGRGDHKQVGLILSERFANLPLELVHPLHKALLDDIEWSCKTPDCPADERPFYRFTHFLGVVRCTQGVAGGKQKRKAGSRTGAEQSGQGQAPQFPKREDEVLLTRSSFSFTFPLATQASEDGEGKVAGARTVFGISAANLKRAVAELQSAMATGVDAAA